MLAAAGVDRSPERLSPGLYLPAREGSLQVELQGATRREGRIPYLLDADKTFQAVPDLAVFFLMLLAGIEMRPGDLAQASGKAVPIALRWLLPAERGGK